MRVLSTACLLLAGCTVHVGVLAPSGAWAVGEVRAPVAEPDVDRWVREAVETALVARRAYDASGPALEITVAEASFSPSRRSGDVLLYDARLTLLLRAGDRTATRTRTWTVVDPGTASGARTLREDTLRTLARQVAEDSVCWLATAPAPSPSPPGSLSPPSAPPPASPPAPGYVPPPR